MNLGKNNVFSPANVTFSGMIQVGAETTQTVYNGRFVISESTDGLVFGTAKYTSATDEPTKVYTPSNTTVRAIKCELYASGGTTTKLDSQTVMITRDGNDGGNGKPGEDSISVILGNEAEVIPCNANGAVKISRDINIPFYAYKGLKRAAVTCAPGSLPLGVTVKTNTAGTTSTDGLLIITIPAGNNLGSASDLSGTFSFFAKCPPRSAFCFSGAMPTR